PHGSEGILDVWLQFSEREWRALRGWQRALHRAVMRSNYHMLLSLGQSCCGWGGMRIGINFVYGIEITLVPINRRWPNPY
uniref:KRAB domain-containing protein n=1 Tax=Falco tinnunculus TaxID=100819 RepID=A0A8C4URN5_FALTI